ncbi:MAG: hypothetical protein ACK5PF_00375 [bacterium]
MKWISAHNLQEWANTLASRTTFPALIADLISASSPSINDFRFPNREKGQVRGFDGVLEAVGAPPYVPADRSIWEFGVGEDFIDKADKDFEKRTNEVNAEVRANSTFVFATPRTWDRHGRQLPQWIEEKKARGAWKDVKCLDGIKIEHWLDLHPAVASYYARYELGVVPETGAYSIREFWDEFSTKFSPALTEDVLLAGREAQAAELLQQLTAGARQLAYAADSADEVIAFVVAAIRRAPAKNQSFLESRTIVVDSKDAARQLASRRGLIFLPRGQARNLHGLLAESGPTIVSAGADEQHRQHSVLARPTHIQLSRAFVSMGMTEAQGYELARQCGRSLAVLARLRPSGTAERPEWLDASEELIPALLACAWQPTLEADKEVLKQLGGKGTYEEVEARLRPLTRLKDPPIDRVDDVWAMRSSVDAFLHLGHLLGKEHLTRFQQQATIIFGTVIETPRPEDVFQPNASKRDTHSRWLRDGMMTTLLHMVALGKDAGFSVPGSSPQQFVDGIVRGLPNLASDHRLLASLREQLPLLAEAAPIPFFEALERLLEGDAERIKPIFDEREDFFAPASPHTGLLWALELLAWSEVHLLRAATCLARLAAIDPGGRLLNRPINSLRDVLLSWAPHTNADHQQRIGVLKAIVRSVPTVAWPLLVKLLPQTHDSVSPTQKPRFAEASPGGQETLTYGIVWRTQTEIVTLAIEHAQNLPERWKILIETLGQLQPDTFKLVVGALERCLEEQGDEERFATWDSLRKEVNRYRTYSQVESSPMVERLSDLDSLVSKFRPKDTLLTNSWLFDDWMPAVPGKRDAGNPMGSIEDARLDALKEVLESHGLSGIAKLAARVRLPTQMAGPISKLSLDEADSFTLVRHLLTLTGDAKSLATLVVGQAFSRFQSTWERQVRVLQDELRLDAVECANLFLALNDSKEAWDLVASFGPDVDDEYWRRKHVLGFSGTPEELAHAIKKYLAFGRTVAAIEATHPHLHDVSSATLLDLLNSAIPEINASSSKGAMLEYYVEHIFDELAKRDDVSREDLAKMEFAYLPFLQRRKHPLTLHKMLVESPEFFNSVVCTVFKAASEEAPVLTEQQQKLATAAYELLNSLRVLPGQVEEDIDFATLKNWTDEVRNLATKSDRSVVTDSRIGFLLAHSPSDPDDGAWPHKSVRQLIEYLSSDKVEQSVKVERFNMRGVFSKSIGEGGQQERALGEQARTWARAMSEFPRCATLLQDIAGMWFLEGERADAYAAKDALRG